MNKPNVINFLKNQKFFASKKMGQNFLINESIKKKIVNSAFATKNDLIIEIGPGLGAITEIILKYELNLLAIELDKRLFFELQKNFSLRKNFLIINNDILKLDLNKVIKDNFNRKFENIIVVANLPYSISTKIISFLATNTIVNKAIIMVQKEMAQRMVAKVNSKKYNAFTSWINLICHSEILFDVSSDNFIPKPKVMSSVIKLEFNLKYSKEQLDEFKTFLFECFKNRRKTLFNNLLNIYPKYDIKKILEELNIPITIRAQELSSEKLIEILYMLKK